MAKRLLFSLLWLATFSFQACKSSNDTVEPVVIKPTDTVDNSKVNSWIFENMSIYYLWNDEIPDSSQLNFNRPPSDFFESLLYKPETIDRFSWIQEDVTELRNSLNGIVKVAGVRFAPFDMTNGLVGLAISLVLKNSPAEKAGLIRGDIIVEANDVKITKDNYTTALNKESLHLKVLNKLGKIRTVNVTKAEHQTDPIQLDTILQVGNKKVGYFLYLQFLSDYDNSMRESFRKFKSAKIDELVVDFRFNGGGYVSSAEVLSSLIVKDLKPGTLMFSLQYNSIITEYLKGRNELEDLNSKWLEENTVNVGDRINRVFFLTSNGTASASELVINNLRPFMNVVLIGEHTYGKNVGSFTIDDKSNGYRWKWGMQPISFRTVNAVGQSDYGTVNGMAVDHAVEDNIIPFRPLASLNEPLLAKAIEIINPSMAAITATESNLRIKPVRATLLQKRPQFEAPSFVNYSMFVNPKNSILKKYLEPK